MTAQDMLANASRVDFFVSDVLTKLAQDYGLRPSGNVAERARRAIAHLYMRRRDVPTTAFLIANQIQRGAFNDQLS